MTYDNYLEAPYMDNAECERVCESCGECPSKCGKDPHSCIEDADIRAYENAMDAKRDHETGR